MKKKEPSKVPTVYVPCRSGKDILPAVKKAAERMEKYQRIGLITTSQHLHLLESAAEMLLEQKKKPVMGGQILGCNVANAEKIKDKVDAFLYIGSGMFHPSAFLRAIDRPLYVANPYTGEVMEYSDAEKSRWAGKQKARIMRCLEAKIYGILVSTKTGQFNYSAAEKIKKKLEKRGRKAYVFAGAELSPDRLLGYKVDAWVNTACPRIVDDYYEKPVINPEELDMLMELI
ncbi:MAG: diphthamide synthesis protein [Candidatus Altiarchaeia archaeon]